jgi:hypothetical protein
MAQPLVIKALITIGCAIFIAQRLWRKALKLSELARTSRTGNKDIGNSSDAS